MNLKTIAKLKIAFELTMTIVPMFFRAAADGKISGAEIAEMVAELSEILDLEFEVDWADGWDDENEDYQRVA